MVVPQVQVPPLGLEEVVVPYVKERPLPQQEQQDERAVPVQEECGDSTLTIHLESKCKCLNLVQLPKNVFLNVVTRK